MKLRRKLAALLICALVAGSMPTVSFAAPLEEGVESEYSEGEAADDVDSEEADAGDDKGSEESEEAADSEGVENSESDEAADSGEGEDPEEDAAEDAGESDESDEAEDSEEAEESGGTEDAEESDEAAEAEDSEGSEDEAETKESDSTEEGKTSEDNAVTDETSGTEESSEAEEETSDTVDETDDSADDVTESSTETTVEEEYDLASDADADMELEYDLEVGIMAMSLAVEKEALITDEQKETLETLIEEGKALVDQDESLTDLAECIKKAEELLLNEEATSEEAEVLINSLTELIEAANTSAALSGSAYVLMNIPYAEFYEAELNNDVEVDGFTSATLNKTRTWSLSGGSYHINEDGSDITGITYPVYVEDLANLADCEQVTDDDSVTISVTNRGTTSETTYTGKQALYENESYAYYVLGDDEEPDWYKVLTVESNGTFSFGEVQGAVEEIGASTEITTESNYGDYQITVDGIGDYVTAGTDDVYAVILGTEEGNSYGLRHVENVWRVSNLAFCTGFTAAVHNCPTSSDHYKEIMGQTIKSITYYTSTGNYTFDVDLYVPKKFEYGLTVEDAVVSDGQTTFTLTGLPDDYKAEYSVEGLTINVDGNDGVIIFDDSDAEAGSYTLIVSDAGGVYADLSASFTLKAPLVYVSMNVPYGDFYGSEDVEYYFDVVSTATTSKFLGTTSLAKGTYNDGTDILGVVYPVAMEQSVYDALKESSLTENDDYYIVKLLEETPAAYKTLTYSGGIYSFSEATGKEGDASTLSVSEAVTTSSYGDYMIELVNVLTADSISIGNTTDINPSGVILETADGNTYGMGMLENIWVGTRVTNVEVAFSVVEGNGLTNHGEVAFKQFEELNGATITSVKLVTDKGIYTISCNVKLPEYYAGEDKVEAEITDAETLTISIPAAFENATVSVSYTSGRTTVYAAQDAEVVDGKVTLSGVLEEETTYKVTVNSSNYASKIVSVTYGEATEDEGITEEQIATLNELIGKGQALVDLDASLTLLASHVAEAQALLVNADATSAEAEELIAELEELIAEAGTDYIVIIDGVEVITDALYNEDGSIDLTNTELFSEGADGAYFVTVGGVTQLVGNTTLEKWVGSYENWQSWIYPSEELLEQYPHLEEAWDLAYEAYIAAFEAYGMGDYIKAMYPDTESLKAYWYGMTDTYGVEYMEVEETADGSYVLSWLDEDGNVLASDSYTMTGKVLNGLEGAIMYVFTADNLDEGSEYKYWVTMEPDMEGTTEFPIAAHFHFQYGSDIESLLVYGQLYNDTTKNIADRTWYATMIDADADALAKYNVILGMHMAEKWSELPEEDDDLNHDNTGDESSSSSSSGRPASSNATSHGSSSGGSGSSSSASSGSTWVQDVENDDNTWRLRRTNGSYVAGSVTTDENGNAHEQIAWAQVNGAWYAFGPDGYADQGWVLDYAAGKWYFIDINSGMKSGWHHDDQDNYWYYLDPSSGAMRIGWNQIDGNWYYFNSNPLTYTWNYDESTGNWVYDTGSVSKPLGAMYAGETTPDGYAVDENGTWIQ